jgi:hypothetical protein
MCNIGGLFIMYSMGYHGTIFFWICRGLRLRVLYYYSCVFFRFCLSSDLFCVEMILFITLFLISVHACGLGLLTLDCVAHV